MLHLNSHRRPQILKTISRSRILVLTRQFISASQHPASHLQPSRLPSQSCRSRSTSPPPSPILRSQARRTSSSSQSNRKSQSRKYRPHLVVAMRLASRSPSHQDTESPLEDSAHRGRLGHRVRRVRAQSTMSRDKRLRGVVIRE